MRYFPLLNLEEKWDSSKITLVIERDIKFLLYVVYCNLIGEVVGKEDKRKRKVYSLVFMGKMGINPPSGNPVKKR